MMREGITYLIRLAMGQLKGRVSMRSSSDEFMELSDELTRPLNWECWKCGRGYAHARILVSHLEDFHGMSKERDGGSDWGWDSGWGLHSGYGLHNEDNNTNLGEGETANSTGWCGKMRSWVARLFDKLARLMVGNGRES